MIHYHGTPCGNRREEVARFLAGRHALIPWSNPEDIATAAEVCQSFCVDNGAFSAWKTGKPVKDWTPYFEFVAKWSRHPAFDFAILPDEVDGDERANDALISKAVNWHRSADGEFKGQGARWAPVWHLHESLDRLARLVATWYRVCLGSSGEFATVGTDKWWHRMGEAMEAACDEDGQPRAKLHGLRMLDPAVFHRLPLTSADSTNAVRNSHPARFGMYPAPNAGTRMAVIAERIESHSSAAVWVRREKQGVLVFEKPKPIRDGKSIEHYQQTVLGACGELGGSHDL